MKQQNYVAYSIASNAIGRKPENGPQRGDFSENISHTLDTQQPHAVENSFYVRRLTPTECERLQGFPDGWTAGFADTVRYRMLGNAVAVPCAEWIARQIIDAEQG